VTERTLARRYAQALFDVVGPSDDLDRAAGDLAALAALVAGHADLRRVFEAPGVPAERKRAVASALVEKAGFVEPVGRLVDLLADRDRLALIGGVARAFADRVMQSRRVIPAEIVTAVPLEDRRRRLLAEALSRATGGTVTVTERVDPSIIGGVVARVGSVVFDGSVTKQIERMRDRLLAET
jgi:F-type H+-transporting ATPase subunit delta